jgi:hypothetical protein
MLVAGVKRHSGSTGPHGTIFSLLAAARCPVMCVPAGARTLQVENEDAALASAH